jgi:phospholipid/cholesterol/gamma-HCH transport system permease protein
LFSVRKGDRYSGNDASRRGAVAAVDADGHGRLVLRPTHEFDRAHAAAVWAHAVRALNERSPARLVVDLADVSRIDAAGVAIVQELERRCRRRGIDFSVERAAPGVSEFLEFARRRSGETPPSPPPRAPRTSALARRTGEALRAARSFVELVGRFAESGAHLAVHPRDLRVRDIRYQVQRVGAEGMWLLGGLSVLLGIIIAFQGVGGARSFGSSIFVADVVTLATTREMAPLLTGVIVSGRSGAAIAAEISTMKIDQELDALSVMGFDVVRFLLVPRTLALVIATPLLTLLSMGAGILGGAAVGVFVLHLGVAQYFGEVQKALSAAQVASALAKGTTFALLIGVVSCFEGLQARKAAEEVGNQTKAAVVRSILLVIAADAFFSILSEVYSW